MKRVFRKLRQHHAAGAAEYALLVGLITLGAIGAVAATGTEIRDLFGEAETRVAIFDSDGGGNPAGEDPGENPGQGGEPAGTGPVVMSTFSATTISSGEIATYSWSADNADSLTASARYAGTCGAAETLGMGVRALPWAALNGSASFPWSADVAGCSEEVCVSATNAVDTLASCSTLAYTTYDGTPDAFDFVDVVDAVASTETTPSVVISEPVTPAGYEVQASVALDSYADGAAYRLDGGAWQTAPGIITPGQTLQLKVNANTGSGDGPDGSRSVIATIGGVSAAWLVTNQDTNPDPFAFTAITEDPDTIVRSNNDTPVVLSGFTGSLDLVLVTNTIPSMQGGADVTIDGVTTQHMFVASNVLTIPVTAGAEVTLWLKAGATDGDVRSIEVSLGTLEPAVWEVTTQGPQRLVLAWPTTRTWTVPAGVTQIDVKAWGGGGGGARSYYGGGAGAAVATLNVTPGQELTLYVASGGGGTNAQPGVSTAGGTGYRPGGNNSPAGYGAAGGGASAIVSGSNVLVVAAGGGGSGWGASGGAGGGASGLSGGSFGIGQGGGGGTQVQDGLGGAGTVYGSNGSSAGGGNAATYAGGGGGGWYSGGGGGNNSSSGGGGGGGGSSYINPAFGTGTLYAGSSTMPGNAGDSDRQPLGAGNGGTSLNGASGLIVIDW